MKTLIVVFGLLGAFWVDAGTATVEVHLLDHTDKKQTKERFWIEWRKTWRGIVETKEVTDEQATKIIGMLRTSLTKTEAMHFCGHEPIYGIVAKDEEGKILRTSLCFSCPTWVKPGRRLEISGKRGSENELCKELRKVIELPKELIDPEMPVTSK